MAISYFAIRRPSLFGLHENMAMILGCRAPPPARRLSIPGWRRPAYELRLGPYDARLAKLFPWLCVNADTVYEQSEEALRLFNDRLSGRDWIALDIPTVADVAAFPAISQCGDGDISLANYGAVAAWADRVRSLPGFIDILDRMAGAKEVLLLPVRSRNRHPSGGAQSHRPALFVCSVRK